MSNHIFTRLPNLSLRQTFHRSATSTKLKLSSTASWLRKHPITSTYLTISLVGTSWLVFTDNDWRRRTLAHMQRHRSDFFNYRHTTRKAQLLSSMNGHVLELDACCINNLPHLPINAGQIYDYIAVDSQLELYEPTFAYFCSQAAVPAGLLQIQQAVPLKHLQSLPSNSLDSILSTLHLSRLDRASIFSHAERQKYSQQLTSEIHRVLKPGGRYYFVEYTAHNDSDLLHRAVQKLWSSFTSLWSAPRCDLPVIQTIHSNGGWQSVYCEQWPSFRDAEGNRRGITAVTLQSAPNDEALSSNDSQQKQQASVSGLHGVKALIAGIAVKNN